MLQLPGAFSYKRTVGDAGPYIGQVCALGRVFVAQVPEDHFGVRCGVIVSFGVEGAAAGDIAEGQAPAAVVI